MLGTKKEPIKIHINCIEIEEMSNKVKQLLKEITMEKKISEMTEKEILRQQLELLAKQSVNHQHDCEALVDLTRAFASVAEIIVFTARYEASEKACHRLHKE